MPAAVNTSITPWLSVGDCGKAVAFYASAFGAVSTYRLETPDGSLMVAKLAVDDAVFWVGEEAAGTPGEGKVPVRMILTVRDPDAVFTKALAAGAEPVFPVGEQHGWRLGRLVDPFGHHWEIGHPL